MSEPSREHVEAVARTFSSDEDRCGVSAWTNTYVGGVVAKIVLTSTDPAVLDAMQDALVRAGRLTETWHEFGVRRPEPYEGVISDGSPPMSRAEAERSSEALERRYGSSWPVVSRRRFVTEWEPLKGGDDA